MPDPNPDPVGEEAGYHDTGHPITELTVPARWTCTRAQLIEALANIEIRGIKATGPAAGKVVADDFADAILSQLPEAEDS